MKFTIVCLLLTTSTAIILAQPAHHYENTFCMQRRCPNDGYIRCKSDARCIHPGHVCDGFNHCKDGSDEENCGPAYYGCRGFLCDNRTRCLSKFSVCNGYASCDDGSDEADCLTGECPFDADVKCNGTGRCLRSPNICDGYSSCTYGDDEENCDSRPCPYDSDFRCNDGYCIRSSLVCNRYNNCRDGSDEINCEYDCPYADDIQCDSRCYRSTQICYGGQRCNNIGLNCSLQSCPYDGDFRCSNGGCVRSYDVCNGVCNCHDCSDELNCTSLTCEVSNYFDSWCPRYNNCMHRSNLCYSYCGYNNDSFSRCYDCRNSTVINSPVIECDGINDCEDGNDEFNCYEQDCFAEDDFRCTTTGGCIRRVHVCDGKQHCSDNSDEENCLTRNCSIPGDIKCRDNGNCIHSDMICNEISDCMDGSDEENCSAKSCPFPGDMRCNSSQACIRASQWCNNYIDCDDGSDEDHCYDIPCHYNGDFRCTYGGSCIRGHEVCDRFEHCLDGSDEGMNYCPEDFALGVLWERSLTKTTYKHKCSDIHPSFKFADTVTRYCMKNRTWAPVDISQCVMDSDSPVIMIVVINLGTDNSSLVQSMEDEIIEQVKEMIIEYSAIHIDILQSTVNVSLRMTYEFTTLSVNELVEVTNYEMTLTTLGNFSVTSVPQLTIFESTDICQCPNVITSSTIPTGVDTTSSIEILSVCSGRPCNNSCGNYSNCKCIDPFVGNGIICGKDSDGDGYPDMMLDCDDPHCVQDNCPTVYNPKQNQICNITNDATINFEKTVYSVDENGEFIQLVFILSNPVNKDFTVKILSREQSADVGDEDYGSGPYYITLTAGLTRLPFNISILDDDIFEEDENFILTIDPSSLPCSLSVGNHGQATVTILEDDSDNCSVSTIFGKVSHNSNNGKTVFRFKADDSNAKYTCKLDNESYKSCTSPVIWRDLKKGSHTVIVRAGCSIPLSSAKMKIDFKVR